MINIAVFASGNGSNFQRIAEYFKNNDEINISILITNNPKAFAITRAESLKIDSFVFDRTQFYKTDNVIEILKEHSTNFIVLAGFLWLIPKNIIKEFPNSIVNIHPALLPKYGGKGMYGMNVHEAVVANNESESGITIHYVNEHYDEGDIIFQAKCNVAKNDTASDVANKIHDLEYEFFPKIIEKIVLKKQNRSDTSY